MEPESPEKVSYTVSIKALLTGLYFMEKTISKKCIELLTNYSYEEISMNTLDEYSISKQLVIEISSINDDFFIRNFSYWMLDTMNRILRKYIGIRDALGPLGYYQLLYNYRDIDLDCIETRLVLIDLMLVLCKNNTLTALWAGNSDLVLNLIRDEEHCKKKVLDFISFIGNKAISVIKDLRESGYITTYTDAVLYLKRIPIHFKRKNAVLLIETIINYLEASIQGEMRVEMIFLMSHCLEIFYQIFIGGEREWQNDKSFTCSHASEFIECLPIVSDCSCGAFLCSWCTREHLSLGHQIVYKLYLDDRPKICRCDLRSHRMPEAKFNIEEVTFHQHLVLTTNKEDIAKQHVFLTESENERLEITSLEPHKKLNFYYEIYIKSAGYSEGISVGLKDSDTLEIVKYSGKNGVIRVNNEQVAIGPRFGTKDTIGIGITSNNIVFFTYNGYNLHIYLEETSLKLVFPLVILKGRGIKIAVNQTNFLFASDPFCDIDISLYERFKSQVIDSINFLVKSCKKHQQFQPELKMLLPFRSKFNDFIDFDLGSFKSDKNNISQVFQHQRKRCHNECSIL